MVGVCCLRKMRMIGVLRMELLLGREVRISWFICCGKMRCFKILSLNLSIVFMVKEIVVLRFVCGLMILENVCWLVIMWILVILVLVIIFLVYGIFIL